MALCFRCYESTDQTCYIELLHIWVTYTADVDYKGRYYSTPCCDRCYRLGRSIVYQKVWALLLSIGLGCLALGGCTATAKGLGPERWKEVEAGFFFGGLALWVFGVIAIYTYVIFSSRSRIRKFLGKELEEQMKDIVNTKRWGIRKSIRVMRRVPRERAVPLSSLRARPF